MDPQPSRGPETPESGTGTPPAIAGKRTPEQQSAIDQVAARKGAEYAEQHAAGIIEEYEYFCTL